MTDDAGPIALEEFTASDNGVVVGTGKTRRKRRKKKKKKKKTASGQSATARNDNENDSSDDDDGEIFVHALVVKNGKNNSNNKNKNKKNLNRTGVSGASNLSTPQEILRQRLIESDGFEASQIDQAMEEMWEKGMPYDEYDSVINFLHSGVCGITASTASNSVISVSTTAEEGNEEIETTEAKIGEFGLQPTENREDTTVVAATKTDGGDANNENDDEEEFDSNIEESAESSPKPTSSISIAQKLDTVAGFENLTDAIFALNQWVKQAANDEEFELFCRAEETSALSMVIQRGISYEIEENKRFESAVQPALVGLLMSVLNRCGIDFLVGNTETEIIERMGSILKHARKVSLFAADQKTTDDDTVTSNGVSRFIVSRLIRAMDELKEYNKSNNSHHDYMGELSRSLNIGNDNDAGMVALISERDAIRADAKHACDKVKISMFSLFGDAATDTSSNGVANGHAASSQLTSSLEIQNIMLYIVDEETKNRFHCEKARFEVLKSQVRPKGESSDTVKTLRGSLHSLETKRQRYQEKIAELKAAMQELELQDEEAALQIEDISMQLVEEERSDDSRTKKLEQDLSEAKEFVRYGNLVSGLAGMMKTFGKSIEKVTASKTGKTISDDAVQESSETKDDEKNSVDIITEASASYAMEYYLSKIRKYFLKEAHCATKLRERLITKKAEQSALQSELLQYNSVKGLGSMPTIISQLQKSVVEKEQTIRADTHSIAALMDDGRFMYDKLLESLRTYHSNTTLAALFPTKLLSNDVSLALQALGIVENCDELVPFMIEQAAEKSTNDSETSNTVMDDLQLSIMNQSPASVALVPPLPTKVAPKLSWATPQAKLGVASQEKYSLLEIQKEESIRSSWDNNERDDVQ